MKQKYPVIFLDRDGVITKEKSYVTCLNQVELFPYAKMAVELLQHLGYKIIVITNQSAVARGMMSEAELQNIHEYIYKETGVDAIYYCPHYPPVDEEILPYRIHCKCRKPHTQLLEQAIKEHNLTKEKSFFVGDRASDILAGEHMGIKTVLVESGYGSQRLEAEVKIDYIFKDLLEFAYFIQKGENI